MDCNTLKKTVAELSTKYEEQQEHIKEIEQQIEKKRKEIEREEQILKDCEGARAQEPNTESQEIKTAKEKLKKFLKPVNKYYGGTSTREKERNVNGQLPDGWQSIKTQEVAKIFEPAIASTLIERKGIEFDGKKYILPQNDQNQVVYIFNKDIKTLTSNGVNKIQIEQRGGKKSKRKSRQ
jgi:hypothetical protein